MSFHSKSLRRMSLEEKKYSFETAEKERVKDDTRERGTWASKAEFFLSCTGYAIGLGNIWRFPYLCYRNGGGAFLIPYLLMLFLCGLPLFYMETSIGQFGNTGSITMFRMSPILKGTGLAILVVNFICTVYYNVIISYPLIFLVMSMRSKLPWADCSNPWNTHECFKLGNNSINRHNLSIGLVKGAKTPADEFFHNEILKISDGIGELNGIVWPLFGSNIVSWIIIFLCLSNGVKSVGKVVYFTATFPFVILFILFVRGITLPGAMDGILFYISPDWSQLTNLKVWADAAIQIFFSLGPGWGGMVTMASYNPFKNNNRMHSIIIPILNCGTSIFAGFVVFATLGYMSNQTGIPVALVATGGPGLAFITYPEAIAMLPIPQLWAALFFSMLYLVGVDSLFVQIETIHAGVCDAYPFLAKHKIKYVVGSTIVYLLGSLCFVTHAGMYLLQLFDWYAASISVILICFFEVIMVAWIYGCKNFVRDLEFMIDEKVHWWWKFSWKYTNPIILFFIFITTILFNTPVKYNDFVYPEWAILLGWSSCIISILCIPGYAIFYILKTKGPIKQRIMNGFKMSTKWGPKPLEYREQWKKLINDTEKEKKYTNLDSVRLTKI